MPAYKRQHYLPAVYLKEFGPEQTNPSRNSLIWRTDAKASRCVPVESQCARDYFYSRKDAASAERMFGEGEAIYGRAIETIKKGKPLTVEDYYGLIVLMADFHIRNSAQENLTGEENIEAYVFRAHLVRYFFLGRDAAPPLPTEDEFAQHLQKYWQVRVVLTPSTSGLVTSDNPSLWIASHHPSPKLQMLFMPLTPRHMAIAFDSRLVQVVGNIMTTEDVGCLNHMQARSAQQAVFSATCLGPEAETNAMELLAQEKQGSKTHRDGWQAHMDRFPAKRPSFIRDAPPLM